MDKVWLQHYPQGIPAEAEYRAYRSLKEILTATCARFADRPAYGNLGVTITYRELDQLSRDFGAYLQKVAGLKKGERLAIMLPNLLQYPIALFGAQRAGVVVVNTNPLYTARELEHQLKDSGASAIVVLENFAHTLEEVLPRTSVRTVITTQIGDLFPAFKRMLTNLVVKHVKKLVPEWHLAKAVCFTDALAAGRAEQLDDVAIGPEDLAFLQYTGGTTGVAKGAMLTQANMVANLQQLSAWIGRDLKDGQEVAVIPLPLYHVYALTANMVFMKIGSRIELITNPRDLPAFVATLKKVPMTAMIGVNTLYSALLNAPGFAHLDLRGLKLASAGGMAVQRAVAERWKQVTGTPLVEGYGLTETAPVVISNPLNIEDWTGNIGLPIPSTEAAVLDDDGRALADRRGRRNLHPWAAGDEGLLAAAGRNRQGLHLRRLVPHRRHGLHGRAGALQDHRSQEGHDHRLGLQGVSERARRRRHAPSGCAGSGRDRSAGRTFRRGREDRRREKRPVAR